MLHFDRAMLTDTLGRDDLHTWSAGVEISIQDAAGVRWTRGLAGELINNGRVDATK